MRCYLMLAICLMGCDGGTGPDADGGAGCPVGTYTDECLPWSDCVPGEFVEERGTSGRDGVDRTCTTCPSESFTSGTNESECQRWTACPPGTYVVSDGTPTQNRRCEACDTGTHSTDVNASTCMDTTVCAVGTVQTRAGTSAMDATCETCVAGEYCAGGDSFRAPCVGSRWDHDANPATPCAAKTTCLLGMYASSEGDATHDRVCANCTEIPNCVTLACTTAVDQICDECDPGFARQMGRTACGLPWSDQFGTVAEESAQAVFVDGDGAVYVAGTTEGSLEGVTSGSSDAFVRKYDSAGNLVWTRQFGTAEDDEAFAVVVSASGAIYVAGETDGTLDGVSTDAGGFLRKYDADGSVVWTRQFGSSVAGARSLAVDGDENVYVAGTTLVLPPGSSTFNFDAMLRKYNSAGALLWADEFGTRDAETGLGVSVDWSGGVYVVGSTTGGLSRASLGGSDAYLRKYDDTGDVLWTRQFGTTEDETAWSVAVDERGDMYVVGTTTGSLEGTSEGGRDAFIRKYDPDGDVAWTRQFGTAASDSATSVAVDMSGIYVGGYTLGALEGASAGREDLVVRKYGSTGVHLWTDQRGTAAYEVGRAVAPDGSGNAYIVANTDGTWPGEASAGGIDALITLMFP